MTERIETKLRAFFGLKALPFLKPAAPEEYLQTSSLTAGLEKLRYLVDRRGIGLLTGGPGTGKSTLLRAFMAGLSKNTYSLAYVAHTTCCAIDLLRLIACGFDISPTHRRADIGRQIKDRILKLSRQNKIQPVLIIDEAHLLACGLLEELRIMTNFDGDARDDLTLLLAGQHQVESTLRLGVHEALAQRIVIRLRLKGWDRDEVDQYILYRLEAAGRTAKLFLPDAVEAIFKASRGVPRLVDGIAEHSLLVALRQHKKDIDAELVTEALDEVEL